MARVRALLAQATSIGDVVAIESELARREADLDSLTNRLAALRDQVAMSTLSVELRTPSTAVRRRRPRAAGFSDGLDAGWRGLVALGTAVAAVGFLLPFLPVLAVLSGWAGWPGGRAGSPVGRAERPGSDGESRTGRSGCATGARGRGAAGRRRRGARAAGGRCPRPGQSR